MAYLAGGLTLAFVVFGWPLWPIGWPIVAALLVADFVLDT